MTVNEEDLRLVFYPVEPIHRPVSSLLSRSAPVLQTVRLLSCNPVCSPVCYFSPPLLNLFPSRAGRRAASHAGWMSVYFLSALSDECTFTFFVTSFIKKKNKEEVMIFFLSTSAVAPFLSRILLNYLPAHFSQMSGSFRTDLIPSVTTTDTRRLWKGERASVADDAHQGRRETAVAVSRLLRVVRCERFLPFSHVYV